MTEEELQEWNALCCLAEDSTDVEVLAALSGSPYVEVREYVAANAAASVATLIKLSKDEDWQVRETVAYHANTPQSVLDVLQYDANDFVRDAAVKRHQQ